MYALTLGKVHPDPRGLLSRWRGSGMAILGRLIHPCYSNSNRVRRRLKSDRND